MKRILPMLLIIMSLYGCGEEMQNEKRFLSTDRLTACDSAALLIYDQVGLDDTIILYYPVKNWSGYIPNCNEHDWPYVSGRDLRLAGVVLGKDINAARTFLNLRITNKDPESVLLLMQEINVGDTTWQVINDVRIEHQGR